MLIITHIYILTRKAIIGPQILNFDRSFTLSPVPQSSLVPPCQISLGGPAFMVVLLYCFLTLFSVMVQLHRISQTGEHRPLTNSLHLTRFGTIFSAEFQLCPCSFNSDSVSLRQVFLGRPLLFLHCGFHLRACLVMLRGGFLSVWPIHAHFLFLICMFMGSWFAPDTGGNR